MPDLQERADSYQNKHLELNEELKQFSAEIGPIKYLSDLFFDPTETDIDKAVRVVILLFIFVFDPLAVLMLVAANHSLQNRKPQSPLDSEKEHQKENTQVNTHEKKDSSIEAELDPVVFDHVESPQARTLLARKIIK